MNVSLGPRLLVPEIPNARLAHGTEHGLARDSLVVGRHGYQTIGGPGRVRERAFDGGEDRQSGEVLSSAVQVIAVVAVELDGAVRRVVVEVDNALTDRRDAHVELDGVS